MTPATMSRPSTRASEFGRLAGWCRVVHDFQKLLAAALRRCLANTRQMWIQGFLATLHCQSEMVLRAHNGKSTMVLFIKH